MKIIERIIPKGQTKQRPGYSMNPKFITVHETANTSKGANAEMHARYLLNGAGGRTVSWHYTVDDNSIYQHLPNNEVGWHAGDGGNGTGNRQSIGVEICVNSDGDFQKAVSNAQKLVKDLMEYHNISIENVVPHKHWTGKNCPANLLNNWSSFKDGIDTKAYQPKKQPAKPKAQVKQTDYKGNSIVDYLNHINEDSSFSNRKRLARKHGISNYRGTANQNTLLLSKLRGGSKSSNIDQVAQEVIEGKWGNGNDRKRRLENAGYNFREVQNRVNKML